ncbi:hypothetical protein L3V79_08290 [Thiotrichales bacterium 19S9-12]|nr:hypothetical protein [Thiotrichales bacterium 19S9-11]MCF6812352.1 hypothetical protein [Thiotrichales bacterium 19S9-12]
MSNIIAFISFFVSMIFIVIKKLFLKPKISFQELNKIRLQLLDEGVDKLTKKYLLEDVFSVFRRPLRHSSDDVYNMLVHIFLAYQYPRNLKLFLSNLRCFRYYGNELYVLPYFFTKRAFRLIYITVPYVFCILFIIFGFAVQDLLYIEKVFSIEDIDPVKGILLIVFIILATVFILFLINELFDEIRSTFAIKKILNEFDLKKSPCDMDQPLFKIVYRWYLKNIKRLSDCN